MSRSALTILSARGFLLALGFLLLCLSAPLGFAQAPDDYAAATARFRAGEYADAALLFQKAEATAPGKTDALVFAAKAFVRLEKYADADTSLHAYLGEQPNSPEALYLLGYVLNRENRPSESLAVYTKAAALQPPLGDDLKIVGLDYVLLNDYADAIHWLEKAVQLDDRNYEAWYFLGRAYYTRTRISEAGAAFEKALQLKPHDSKAENNFGLVLEAEARPAEAMQAYRSAIEWQQKEPRQSEQPYLNLGSILLDQDRSEEALPSLEQAVKLGLTNPLCHQKLGTAFLRLSKLGEAQKELEAAARLDPENAATHFQLGKLYKQMHAMDRAQKEFARAEEIQSRAAAGAVLKKEN